MRIINPFPFPIPKPGDVFGLLKRVVTAGKRFLDVLIKGDDIKEKAPLNTQNGTVDGMIELSTALSEYRNKVKIESKQLEETIAEVCRNVFEGIIESVEFANADFQFYRIERLKRKFDSFIDEIDGIFERNVGKRLSLDDSECIAILKMPAGELKGQRMAELKKKVFAESVVGLCKRINEFQDEFFESIEMSVDSRLETIEEKLQEKASIFETLTKNTDVLNEQKEKVTLEAGYMISLTSIFNNLESEVE